VRISHSNSFGITLDRTRPNSSTHKLGTMVPLISPANTSSEEDKSKGTGCTGSSPNSSLAREAFTEETWHTGIVVRFSKRSLQITMLVALGCFFVNRQVVTLGFSSSSSSRSIGTEEVKSQLHGEKEPGVLGSFLMQYAMPRVWQHDSR
jgi:hypothetical protein